MRRTSALIHPSSWKGDSANFAPRGFSEIRYPGSRFSKGRVRAVWALCPMGQACYAARIENSLPAG
jgi:hypothetical protein